MAHLGHRAGPERLALALSVVRDYQAAVVINAFVGLASIIIMVRVIATRHSRPVLWPALVVTSTLAACAAVLVTLGPAAAGTLGSVASAFVWVPQAAHAVLTRSRLGLSWAVVLAGLASSAILSLIVTAAYALWQRPDGST